MSVVSRMEIFTVDHGSSLRWTEAADVCHLTTTFLRVTDSEGVEGLAGHDSYTQAPSDRSVLEALRSLSPVLLGRDADDRDGVADDLRVGVVFPFSTAPVSMMDIALWDVAARRAGLPLCRLLEAHAEGAGARGVTGSGGARTEDDGGAGVKSAGARTRIPAYASLETMPRIEDYLNVVGQARDEGLRAVKVHAWGEPERDVELLERLRAAYPDMALMHDAEGVYDHEGALLVGRALDRLEGRWFEAPFPDFDLQGYRELKRQVRTPILAAGYAMWDPLQVAEALRDPPWSAVRSEVTSTLGISALCRMAEVAQAHGMDFEPVSYGHALCQAANLHVMLAYDNVRFFELPYPVEPWEYGVLDPIRPGPDGTVGAPDGPGLGLHLDWEWITSHAFATASLAP